MRKVRTRGPLQRALSTSVVTLRARACTPPAVGTMAGTSGAAAGESDLERVQRRIRKVDADLDDLEAKLNTEQDEGEKTKIKVEIRENKGLLKSLTERATGLEAKMGGNAVPGACRLSPRPTPLSLLCHTAAHRAQHLATTRASA
jgi:hypothetical protein